MALAPRNLKQEKNEAKDNSNQKDNEEENGGEKV